MAAGFNIPRLTRQRRKEKVPEVIEFLPVEHVFKPQRQVIMLKDLTGWLNNDKRLGKKWHLRVGPPGPVYYLDDAVADSFIIKGYAKGELSRDFSDDERAAIRASVTNISLTPTPGAEPTGVLEMGVTHG